MEENNCTSEQPRIFKKDVVLQSSEKLDKLTCITKALSDPIRLQILYLLQQHKDICTCEFQGLLDLSQSKISYHIKILLDAGLIKREVFANWRHYSLADINILEKIEKLIG